MNKNQLTQVLEYLDTEYAGITARMTEDERKQRAKHWSKEIGMLDFDSVMSAVRKLSQGQYMPRTAEVIREVQSMPKVSNASRGRQTCRIQVTSDGTEVFQLKNSDGTEVMSGTLRSLPEWMAAKFRWLADPNPENTAAWDQCISQYQPADGYGTYGKFRQVDALIAAAGGAA